MSDTPEPTGNVIRLNVGGKEGKLTTSSGQIPVRVFERGGDQLMLVLMLDAADELEQESAESLSVEYVSPRGLVRFHGEAVLEDRDLIRFHVSADPELTQRREFVRVTSVHQVLLGVEGRAVSAVSGGAGGDQINAHAIDISGGGMLLGGPDALELDARVRFSLHLGNGEPPIEGRARVVRAAGEGRQGLVFEQISQDERQRLIHFVFECQREALAKTGSGSPVELTSRRRKRAGGGQA
jgi:c-di-GMP-binding flagellar brake protein YcgR